MSQPRQITISGIMKELDLSQEEFALLFGCYQHQVSQWTSGKTRPSRLRSEAILQRYSEVKSNPSIITRVRDEVKRRRQAYRRPYNGEA